MLQNTPNWKCQRKNFETIAADANFAGFKSVYDTMKLFSNGMRGAMSSWSVFRRRRMLPEIPLIRVEEGRWSYTTLPPEATIRLCCTIYPWVWWTILEWWRSFCQAVCYVPSIRYASVKFQKSPSVHSWHPLSALDTSGCQQRYRLYNHSNSISTLTYCMQYA